MRAWAPVQLVDLGALLLLDSRYARAAEAKAKVNPRLKVENLLPPPDLEPLLPLASRYPIPESPSHLVSDS